MGALRAQLLIKWLISSLWSINDATAARRYLAISRTTHATAKLQYGESWWSAESVSPMAR